jgi:ribonuclease HI
MAEEVNNLKLMWVPVHTGINRNKEADKATKESLE